MDDDCCPLCMDQLDATDKAINYCACGYRMCLWCWNQLMETAGKENLPGRCPNCRAEYDKEKITMSALDPSVVEMEQQRKKETKKKGQMAQQHRPPRSLGQVRVVQRTLVYCVGLPMNICREEMLAERHYFGGFGRIKKISVNRSTPFSQVQKNGPSGSAYVTYYRAEDALRCIEAIDGTVWDGKTIKACFGTTKYCNAFLKGVPCNNTDCLYLHEIADAADSFSKEDMVVNGLTSGRSTFFDLVHPTNTKEASAHAHAVIHAANGNGDSSGCSTDTAAGPLLSALCSTGQAAVAAGTAAAGPAGAGLMHPKTQPIAIVGGRISSSNPWGSGTGDSAATSPAPAAAGQWGSTPKLTPTALRSQLADMEWPSLGGEMEVPKAAAGLPGAAQHQQQQQQQQPQQQQQQAERGGGAQQGVSGLVAAGNGKAVAAAAGSTLTLAAVTAGLGPPAAGAPAANQQPATKQRKGGTTPLSKPAKAGKAASHTAVGDAGKACSTAGGKGTGQDVRAGSKEAQAAAAAPTTNIVADSSSNSNAGASGRVKDLPSSRAAPAAEPVANGKLTKQEGKALKSAAAAAAVAAAAAGVAVPAPVTPGPAVPAPAVPEPPAAARDSEAVAAAAAGTSTRTAVGAQDSGSPIPPAGPAAKSPPPGFSCANVASAVKGPPPGFSGQVKPVQQRLPPPGFEPSLLALARAASSSNVSQLGPGASSTRSSSPGGGGSSDATAAAVVGLGHQTVRQLAPDGPAGFGQASDKVLVGEGPPTNSSEKIVLLDGQQDLGRYHQSNLCTGHAAVNGGPVMPGMSHAFDINAFFDSPAVGKAPGAPFDVSVGLLGQGKVLGAGGGSGPEAAAAAHAAVTPLPLSARKQSRWGFAQQSSPAAAAAPSSPGGGAAVPQQVAVTPPPGFSAAGFAAAGGSPGLLHGNMGSFANQTQQATSFFKSLLPGVNVHVASPGAAAAAVGNGAAGGSQPDGGSVPNPGLLLLQQLQRGQQQQPQQQQQQQRLPASLWNV